ncbi:hypothetical protein BA011_28935 (plasmid) [Rhizobium leguminosarum]|uniref:Uncharacterized protein n=1 Tax=Rhizobium leguminosarum TaxID=384 RepID=A0A1B1CJ25_RHILE|nr:hypothetical protein BA011_28935 [Rhizobium leguminosarum]
MGTIATGARGKLSQRLKETESLPNRAFELKAVRGIDFRVGLGVAWNKEDPTASRDDIVDIARSLARPGR